MSIPVSSVNPVLPRVITVVVLTPALSWAVLPEFWAEDPCQLHWIMRQYHQATHTKQSDDEDTVPPLIMDNSKDNRGSDDDGIIGPPSMQLRKQVDFEGT